MKTKITLVLLLVASSLSLKAQIHNPSFENWSGGDPVDWNSLNGTLAGVVTQVSDAHAGSSAAQLNVVPFFGTNVAGSLTSGSTSGQGFLPVASAPVALHGWYKFHSVSPTEEVSIIGIAEDTGSVVATCVTVIQTNTLVYTEFISNFTYIAPNIADSAEIYIAMSASDSNRVGSYFIIDDLSFGPAGTTGVRELSSAAVLEQCNPNPATHVANIIYSVAGDSKVSLAIYDMVGHQVKTLLEGLDQSTGRYKVPTDVSDLSEGIYFYRLNVNGQSYTQKLVVAK